MTISKDPEGPNHSPGLDFESLIHGVVLQRAPVVEYSNGLLTELYRPEWASIFLEGEPIEHLYTVFAPEGGTRAEWYFHEQTLDRYMLLQGGLDVGLYDARADSPTRGTFFVASLNSFAQGYPNGVRIPPGVWHSLKWTTEQGLFLNAKLPGFNPTDVDKYRIPMEDLPEAITWNIG